MSMSGCVRNMKLIHQPEMPVCQIRIYFLEVEKGPLLCHIMNPEVSRLPKISEILEN